MCVCAAFVPENTVFQRFDTPPAVRGRVFKAWAARNELFPFRSSNTSWLLPHLSTLLLSANTQPYLDTMLPHFLLRNVSISPLSLVNEAMITDASGSGNYFGEERKKESFFS